ncbi:MAG: FmdB family zinc ribbon protein [Bryobacteraceae bacterium]|jgi:putative FmdB family regulatory protein
MPLYEYHCHRCGKTFELLQRFSDEPLKLHEGCGGEVEKLISRSAIRFKGSGWYVNDYGHGKGPAENGGGKTSSENGGGKTEKKTAQPAAEPAGSGKTEAKTSKD